MSSVLRSRRYTLGVFALAAFPVFALAQSTIPSRLTDKELWQLNAEFSEPGGYFRSDNLLSNETGFQAVIPGLKEKIKPGGVTDKLLGDYPNLFGDMSANSGQNALSRDEDHARGFLRRHSSKLMFGSDCTDALGRGPGCTGAGTIALIRKLTSEDVACRLLFENAKRVFRL